MTATTDAPSITTVAGRTVLTVHVTSIRNTSAHDQTFSFDCARGVVVTGGGQQVPQPGPYLILTAATPVELNSATIQPAAWSNPASNWWDGGGARSARPAACGVLDAAQARQDLPTTWSSVAVSAGQTLSLTPKQASLAFTLPDPEGLTAVYPNTIQGLYFISDDRTTTIAVGFPDQR